MSDRQQRRESNERSRRIRQQTIGSHVQRESMRARRTNVNFGNRRRQSRAVRGEITHVVPHTHSAESSAHASRRRRQHGLTETKQRSQNRLRILLIIAAIVAIIAIVTSVVSCVFNSTVNNKMSLNDKKVQDALTQPANATDPYWVLFAGELEKPGETYNGPHLLELMYVNPSSQAVTFVHVPFNAKVSLSDGNTHRLSEAQVIGGDAELITAVQHLTGVNIAHYAKINQDGFCALVDALGGVTIDLPQEVDDPRAGTLYIAPGEQKLDGKAALQAVRAYNYTDPSQTQADVQAAVIKAMLQRVVKAEGFDAVKTFDTIANDFKTDLTMATVTSLTQPFLSARDIKVNATYLPSKTSEDNGVEYAVISKNDVASLIDAIVGGGSVNAQKTESYGAVDPASVTVAVRNGSSIVGAAALASNMLTEKGFQVKETGNTDSPVYSETLVLYSTSADKDAANAVIEALGQGRLSSASTYYSFDTNVLVVIGSDWVS